MARVETGKSGELAQLSFSAGEEINILTTHSPEICKHRVPLSGYTFDSGEARFLEDAISIEMAGGEGVLAVTFLDATLLEKNGPYDKFIRTHEDLVPVYSALRKLSMKRGKTVPGLTFVMHFDYVAHQPRQIEITDFRRQRTILDTAFTAEENFTFESKGPEIEQVMGYNHEGASYIYALKAIATMLYRNRTKRDAKRDDFGDFIIHELGLETSTFAATTIAYVSHPSVQYRHRGAQHTAFAQALSKMNGGCSGNYAPVTSPFTHASDSANLRIIKAAIRDQDAPYNQDEIANIPDRKGVGKHYVRL